MPLQSNLGLLKQAYKSYLRTVANHHRDAGPGGDGTAIVVDSSYVLTEFAERQRSRAEATFELSFQRLQQALDVSELRVKFRAKKERAKQRLSSLITSVSSLSDHVDGRAVTSGRGSDVAPEPHSAAGANTLQPSASTSRPDLAQICGSDGLLRTTVMYLVGHACRAFMTLLNTTTVSGREHLEAALARPPGVGLLTVCNHVAAMDDPLLVAALVPEEALSRPAALKWTLCATDRCFRYAALSPLFTAAKVLPVARGGGMAQPGMAAAEARLGAGDWVHVFPEGTRSADGRSMGMVRKGVGRLVAAGAAAAAAELDSGGDGGGAAGGGVGVGGAAAAGGGRAPLVVPFVHRGMDGVMPRGRALPATGQQVDVLVGPPIPMDDLLAAARAQSWPDDALHVAIAGRVAQHLQHLLARLDAQRAGAPDPGPLPPSAAGGGGGAVCGASGGGGGGCGSGVSSLDQFDAADLLLAERLREERRRRRREGVLSAWDGLKSRMALQQHRTWASQGAGPAGGGGSSSSMMSRSGGGGGGGSGTRGGLAEVVEAAQGQAAGAARRLVGGGSGAAAAAWAQGAGAGAGWPALWSGLDGAAALPALRLLAVAAGEGRGREARVGGAVLHPAQ